MRKGHTGTSLGGSQRSPARRKRDRARVRAEESRWAARSGVVHTFKMTEGTYFGAHRYWTTCSCGWISSMCNLAAIALSDARKHSAGR
jgi:hypothetical protein